jgi:predicted GIY-YIG superfamily endonuclease
MKKSAGIIYLLHFSVAYKHAAHYVGFTTDLQSRLDAHKQGKGARLLEVIAQAGISFQLARTWQGTRKGERQIKNRKAAPRLCPLCNPQAMRRAMKCD